MYGRWWRHYAAIVAGQTPGDIDEARRKVAHILRRCPDAPNRCGVCGHRLAASAPHGARCQSRLDRIAS